MMDRLLRLWHLYKRPEHRRGRTAWLEDIFKACINLGLLLMVIGIVGLQH